MGEGRPFGHAPLGDGDVYLDFTADEGEGRVLAGFGERDHARLSAVKTGFDPDNAFHRDHDIRPAPAMPATPLPRRG